LKYELRNIIIGAINVLVLPSINSDIATWKKLFANILLLIKTYNNSSNSNARINSHAEDGNLEVEYDGGARAKQCPESWLEYQMLCRRAMWFPVVALCIAWLR
jgi:hypothetical protein